MGVYFIIVCSHKCFPQFCKCVFHIKRKKKKTNQMQWPFGGETLPIYL